MALTKKYMVSQGNIEPILEKIKSGTPPEKFTVSHLKSLGFTSSNDRAVIPLLKDLGFLTSDGTPTKRYMTFRDKSQSEKVLGEALLEAYEDAFHISENPTSADRKALEGKFKTEHGSSDNTASLQAATFLKLLSLADISAARSDISEANKITIGTDSTKSSDASEAPQSGLAPKKQIASGLYYNIQIHLPATKEVEVYNAIFRSLKENLIDD